jgi:hypothetical protein
MISPTFPPVVSVDTLSTAIRSPAATMSPSRTMMLCSVADAGDAARIIPWSGMR